MAFLDGASRALLFQTPEVWEDALARYALTREDIALARQRRRLHNRLGFAVQLALIRDLGRPLRLNEIPTPSIVAVVAEPG